MCVESVVDIFTSSVQFSPSLTSTVLPGEVLREQLKALQEQLAEIEKQEKLDDAAAAAASLSAARAKTSIGEAAPQDEAT